MVALMLAVTAPAWLSAAAAAPGDAAANIDATVHAAFGVSEAQHWALPEAKTLLAYIQAIDAEGLFPADYKPRELEAAIAGGEGQKLDGVASRSFAWLAEDLRDGRTPISARIQWYASDPDAVADPTAAIIARALRSGDIAGTLSALRPVHGDYAVLREELARTPDADVGRKALIRANMDRWRWYPRDLGDYYLMVNVPEFRLRLMKDSQIVRSYRTIVGKPGALATPQLVETVEAVIFNPIWTVPRVIVEKEGLGARLIADPAYAKARGFVMNRRDDGSLRVVQMPGPTNALGRVKIDMPNRYGIYVHDTYSEALFDRAVPALSHGCVRAEGALELGMALAVQRAGKSKAELTVISKSGEFTKVELSDPVPAYTGYFTMGRDSNGKLSTFRDLYSRDGPIIASFARPRQASTQRENQTQLQEADR